MRAYTKISEILNEEINNELYRYLQKQKSSETKISKQKEISNIKVEINEMETTKVQLMN